MGSTRRLSRRERQVLTCSARRFVVRAGGDGFTPSNRVTNRLVVRRRTPVVAPERYGSSPAPDTAPTDRPTTVVSDVLDKYRPSEVNDLVWDNIKQFVRDRVSAIPGLDEAKAKRYVTTFTKHMVWCWQTGGYPLDVEVVLAPGVISESMERLRGSVTDASLRTFRSTLMAMSDALTTGGTARAVMPPISRSLASAPYTADEVATLRRWARALKTDFQRVNLSVGLALGLGAGLRASELVGVRARDVTVDGEGVLLSIGGDNPREVPVLAAWERDVADLARAAMRKDQFLIRPRRGTAATSRMFSNLLRRCKTPLPLTTHRMRATWMVGHLAAAVPATTLAKAAGLENTEALRLYLPFVPELDTRQVRSRLRQGMALYAADETL